jgi:DNA-binding MarR family transcriptional regulator
MNRNGRPSRKQLEHLGGALRRICEQTALTREMVANHFDLQRSDRVGFDFIFSRGGTCTAGELSKGTGLTTGSTTALIDRLEKGGYVAREPDQNDRRRQIVRIRQQVFAHCEALYEPIRAEMFALWSSYSVEDLEFVAEFIARSAQVHAECHERIKTRAAHVPKRGHDVLAKTRCERPPILDL